MDVQWIEEKKCYFMAGDSQSATYNYNSQYYTSDDGMHWSANSSGGSGNLYGFTCGLWMRESFKPDGKPIWILGGEGVDTDRRAAGIMTSRDGQGSSAIQFFNDGQSGLGWYASQFFVDIGSSGFQARLETATFADFHTYTSKDGLSWGGGSRRREANTDDSKMIPVNLLGLPPVRAVTPALELPPDFEVTTSHSIDGGQPPNLQALRSATPFTTSSKVKSSNDLYQLSNRNSASGTLRIGPYAGKRVTIKGGKPHGFHGPGTPGSDFFEPGCTVFGPKGGKLGGSNCGLTFVHSLAYGYYVFVAAGGVGKTNGRSALSHTVDGIHWNVQDMGNQAHTMWSLVVGPRV